MPGIKHRIILAIGTETIKRPRELQLPVDADEHSIVHTLYSLQREGLVTYKRRRGGDSPGINLYDIQLTKRGIKTMEALR